MDEEEPMDDLKDWWDELDDLVTWCRTCSAWIPVLGKHNFFRHLLANHPDEPMARAVARVLEERTEAATR